MRQPTRLLTAITGAMLSWCCLAEDAAPPAPAPVPAPDQAPATVQAPQVVTPPPAAVAPQPGAQADRAARRMNRQNGGAGNENGGNNGNGNGGNGPRNRQNGPGQGMFGQGGFGQGAFGDAMNPLMRGGNLVATASRMLGIDVDEIKHKPAKVDSLPLGASRREVLNVPVGGVDLPGATGQGWKMEQIFKLSDEQQKSLQALRDEYTLEQKKLENDIAELQRLQAEKAAALRKTFEGRANDILTGPDKEAKVKMDEVAKETQLKTAAVMTDAGAMYDAEDTQQGMAMLRMIRQKTGDIIKEAEDKLLPLVPADSKQRVEEAVRNNADARNQINRLLNIGGARGRDAAAGGGEDKADRKAMKKAERAEKMEKIQEGSKPPEAPPNF